MKMLKLGLSEPEGGTGVDYDLIEACGSNKYARINISS